MLTTLHTQAYNVAARLYIAFELSDKTWRLTSSDGKKRRSKTVEACAISAVLEEVAKAKQRFKLPAECEIVCCYEAGWEGFWLARCLQAQGMRVLVVDSSSIEVNRRKRSAKTDRVDGEKLLNLLLRYLGGETKALRPVRIPSREEEDDRRLNRERDVLVKERGRHWVRIKSLLRAQGLRVTKKTTFLKQLEALRCWDGQPLPDDLRQEIERQWARHEQVHKQVLALERLQKQRLKEAESEDGTLALVGRLLHLKGIGWQGAWALVMELFAWRKIRNRRELAALVGLTPTPYNSGDGVREQGISKAGNRRLRSLLIELSWLWLRHQPDTDLSQWFRQRFGGGGKRMRRIGIVALARKLLVALWRYVEHGVLPEGAVLKA